MFSFGTDILIVQGEARIGVEICEDLWTPIPPSSHAALAGANVLVNLSASNETIGKAAWRRDLVRSQSGRCIAAYVYASAGPTESSSDLVFGGHCLIAENGSILGESRRVGDGEIPTLFSETLVTSDVDLERLTHDRRVIGSFDDRRTLDHVNFRTVELDSAAHLKSGTAPTDGGDKSTHDSDASASTRTRLFLTKARNSKPVVPRSLTSKPRLCANACLD